jgi:hypothetical protein
MLIEGDEEDKHNAPPFAEFLHEEKIHRSSVRLRYSLVFTYNTPPYV